MPKILLLIVAAIALVQLAAGHAIVVEPRTRQAWDWTTSASGLKMPFGSYGTTGRITPAGDVRQLVNVFTPETYAGCGVKGGTAAKQGFGADTQAKVDTPGKVTVNYTPGTGKNHKLTYKLTIPHRAADPWEENEVIYVKWRPNAGAAWQKAGPKSDGFRSGLEDDKSDAIYEVPIEFPANTNGIPTDAKNAQLQFVWDSVRDGGGYIECADICVSNNCPDIEADAVPDWPVDDNTGGSTGGNTGGNTGNTGGNTGNTGGNTGYTGGTSDGDTVPDPKDGQGEPCATFLARRAASKMYCNGSANTLTNCASAQCSVMECCGVAGMSDGNAAAAAAPTVVTALVAAVAVVAMLA